MARKKVPVNNKPGVRKKPGKQSSQSTLGQFFRFLMKTPMRQLIMTVIIVVLLFVFRESLSSFFETLRELFGWGLLFIFGAIVTIITMFWRIMHHQAADNGIQADRLAATRSSGNQ